MTGGWFVVDDDELIERATRLARELWRSNHSAAVLRAALIAQYGLTPEQLQQVLDLVVPDTDDPRI